jgi:site-specific DNA-methyltransferase (adenine-specific)
MTPYYSDDLVTLYHGDCREITAWLEADVLVTDPPYGIDGHLSAGWRGHKPKGWKRVNEKPEWDETLDVRDAAIDLWNRGGCRPYAVFGSPARLDGALPCREFPLVWDKGTPGMGDVSFPWGRGYELVYVNGDGWTGPRESPVLRVVHSSAAATTEGHPTPKPVGLMAAIIRKAPPGVIADPFTGSGSTLRAAKDEGRQAIGVEMNERYCELAAKRLAQDTLFGGVA